MKTQLVPDGWITETIRTNALGKQEELTYGWEGGRITSLDEWQIGKYTRNLRPGAIVNIGPYRLRVMDFSSPGPSPPYREFIVVRDDFRWTIFLLWLYRTTRWLDRFYRRCIITLAVWGLADYSEAWLPSWRDIRVLKRFSRR
jgi:hypothetical protein